jgi:hypothetical protein
LIGLIAGIAALFFVCGGGALLYFADPFGLFGGGPPGEMLAWAPADTQSITFVNVDEAREVNDFRDTFAGSGITSQLGIRSEEISSIVLASRGGMGLFGLIGGNPDVLVVKLNTSADQNRIISSSGGKEATLNGRKYYKTNAGGAVYFASDRLIVWTRTDATMATLLQKSESAVVISDELRSAARRADGTVGMASTGQAAESSDLLGLMAGSANLFGPGGFGPGGPKFGSAPKARAVVFTVKVSGDRGTTRLESTYDNADTASRIADDLRRSLEQNKSRMTDVESYDVGQSGATVRLTLRGPIKKGKPGFPFGGGM